MSAKERRALERISSHQAATLYLESGQSSACTIEDFCEQGMYVTFASGTIPSDSAIRILRVSFKNFQGRELFVNAEPAHLSHNTAGLRFVNQYPEVVSFLKERYANDSTPKLSVQHTSIIERCLRLIEQSTKNVYESALPLVVQAVRDEAVNSQTDQIANARMNIADRIEKFESTILAKISNEILSVAPRGRKNIIENNSSDLDLVAKGEFEDWLISKVLTTKLEQSLRSPLLLLKMRTDSMGYRSEGGSGSPLGPERLVYAFQTAMHPYLQELALERRAFKILEAALLPELDSLTHSLNEQLAKAGVLPDASLGELVKKYEQPSKVEEKSTIDSSNQSPPPPAQDVPKPSVDSSPESIESAPQAKHHDRSEGRPRASVGYGGQTLNHDGVEKGNVSAVDLEKSQGSADHAPASDAAQAPGVATQSEGFSSIGKLFRKLRNKSGNTSSGVPEGAPLFSHQELHQGLSSLHGQSRDVNEAQTSLLERVLESLNKDADSPRDLNEEQKDQVDVVDRFFGSLQQNPRLTHEGKQHLFRLEIPVLRQLLENDRFFDDHDSPLRDVLNRIAKLGAQGGRLGKIGHQKIEQLVARINEEYDQDHGVVDQVRAELDELIARQHALYLKNVERVAAAADGAHKIDEARKYVAEVVSGMLAKQQVPAALQSLLDNGWLEHLNLLSIKYGKDSAQFSEALGVVEALKQFGQNPEIGFDARRNIPLIQDGLKSISGGVETSKNVREELKQLMLDASSRTHAMVEAKPVILKSESAEEEREKNNIEKSKQLRPWLLRAKAIPLNAWLRFQKEGEAEPQYIRLVWIARAYTKFVFVNHQGLKVIELGAFKFAGYLKDGAIAPDPDFSQPIVKQGLDDMVKEVYEKLAFDSSHDKQSGLPNAREFQRLVRLAMKKGERTQQCCLYYIRMLSGELAEDQESKVVSQLVDLINTKVSDVRVAARLNRYDFVMFFSNNSSQQNISDTTEALNALLSDMQVLGVSVSLMRSEVWGYLGFNNEAALIRNAQQSLSQMEVSEESAGLSQTVSRIELSQSESEDTAAAMFSASDSDAFSVFAQAVSKLSDIDLPDNQELRCRPLNMDVDVGSDFFEPSTDHEAKEMNSWWLAFLARSLSAKTNALACRVPLSAISLTDDHFKEEFRELLECTDMPPERIWFDLYDCSALENEHFAADVIRELQIFGCHFSLEGYGTSDCPARLLQTLPVDLITIDAEVLKAFHDEGEEEPLVNVAHHFDKAVLVKNIDSAIALQKVEKQGVDFVQGERIGAYEPY
ncbi:hypothetical protein A3760_13020 [Oleiphilus sp. HI0122]|nr:hypothetical protein A3737_03565 [Oleiphilus sp. HI0065]KZZ51436.1 hypothetical protein A3760_13020 [Oleiphilus sp. HI0122]KZZ79698.1 hypothetical protein A3767_10835 [Oleiphilus sp. HI0133]